MGHVVVERICVSECFVFMQDLFDVDVGNKLSELVSTRYTELVHMITDNFKDYKMKLQHSKQAEKSRRGVRYLLFSSTMNLGHFER